MKENTLLNKVFEATPALFGLAIPCFILGGLTGFTPFFWIAAGCVLPFLVAAAYCAISKLISPFLPE